MARAAKSGVRRARSGPEPSVALVPVERVERSILLIRGEKVILDSDLADLYDVPTKRLNEQVRRNRDRFPADFMFQLTAEELANLRSQFATSSRSTRARAPGAAPRSARGRATPCRFEPSRLSSGAGASPYPPGSNTSSVRVASTTSSGR